jgi:hypothetical protein
MTHRRYLALGGAALLLALPLVGCGDYAEPEASGGAAGQGGSAGTAQAGTSGTAGTSAGASGTAQAGTGGSSGTAGTGQAGGGAGGGAGTAGTGAEAGTAGTAGTAGSGGGAPVPCPEPPPTAMSCGGDVVGTWTAAMCTSMVTGEADVSGFGLGCPTATITSGSLEVTGTLTFNADGTYQDDTTTSGEQTLELAENCLNISGTVTGCDRVGGPIQGALGYATFDCVPNESTGGCSCEASFEQEGGFSFINLDPYTEGSYTVMDTSMMLEGEDADTEYSYCVDGNTMVASIVTVNKIGTIAGPIVFQK